jgi:hypothetical protein
MIAQAATQQGSLANLLADLSAIAGAAGLPQRVRADAARIAATQTPLDEGVTANELRAAIGRSGIFLEAGLAAAIASNTDPAPYLGSDLKALLLRLAGDLGELPAPASPQGEPAPEEAVPTAVLAEAGPLLEPPPPPIKGGPVRGQPPARPRADDPSDSPRLAATAQKDAQAALARVQLSQAASIPKPGAPLSWSFEIPVATPQGAGVAQFEISRDGRGVAGTEIEPSWRVRFSLDAEPSGPVHAEIMHGHGRTRVTLWAEQPAAAERLGARQDELVRELTAQAGADAAVRVLGGAPALAPAPAGQLVDRRS